MPVFKDQEGRNARFLAQERRRTEEITAVEAPRQEAPIAEPTEARRRRNSEMDPKWDRRWRELAARSEEIWPGRGRWQIEMGTNLWPRLAEVSGKASDEIWKYALEQLGCLEKVPRAITLYMAGMLERLIADPPAAIKQRAADERLPTLQPNLDLPWVRIPEERLQNRIKHALASVATPGMHNRSAASATPQGLPQAPSIQGADPQEQARSNPSPGVHGPGQRAVGPHRRRTPET